MMHGPEKSDPAILGMKPANKPGRTGAESVDRRAGPRRTRARHARAGHWAGKPRHRVSSAYEKEQGKTRK